MRAAKAAFLCAVICAGPAGAAVTDLPDTGRFRVTGVSDGMTLTLEDGRVVLLAGIETPLPPLADQARDTLNSAAQGKMVILHGSADLDRYGRTVTQAESETGDWLEGILLAAGLARVRTMPGHRELSAEMLGLEAAAREAGLGLWRLPHYAVRAPTGLSHSSGSFELVEGVLTAPDRRRSSLRMDFTGADAGISLDKAALGRFATQSLDPEALAGRKVRVRGWVAWFGRPVVEITHPEQIEILDRP